MCKSRASIWWKTVRWTQCNSYEGMWREIQMPSRYITNLKEKFYYPTPQDFLSTIHSLLIWKLLATMFSFACTPGATGSFIEVLMQHARPTRG